MALLDYIAKNLSKGITKCKLYPLAAVTYLNFSTTFPNGSVLFSDQRHYARAWPSLHRDPLHTHWFQHLSLLRHLCVCHAETLRRVASLCKFDHSSAMFIFLLVVLHSLRPLLSLRDLLQPLHVHSRKTWLRARSQGMQAVLGDLTENRGSAYAWEEDA